MKEAQQKQEHTNSYYAVSVNEVTDYPQLEGACSADICVIGGGFTGVSAALTLAERGFSVALVEGNRIGWGASGRNGGQVINGISGLAKITKRHGEGVAGMVWQHKDDRGNTLHRQQQSNLLLRAAKLLPMSNTWLHIRVLDRNDNQSPPLLLPLLTP